MRIPFHFFLFSFSGIELFVIKSVHTNKEIKMKQHIKTLGLLWIVYGALGILAAIIIFMLLFGLSYIPEDIEGPIILRAVALGTSILIAVLSLPEIFAGIGLLRCREWGRILTLVVSFLNLLWFPFGTALSIYSLIVLFNPEAAPLFAGSDPA